MTLALVSPQEVGVHLLAVRPVPDDAPRAVVVDRLAVQEMVGVEDAVALAHADHAAHELHEGAVAIGHVLPAEPGDLVVLQ